MLGIFKDERRGTGSIPANPPFSTSTGGTARGSSPDCVAKSLKCGDDLARYEIRVNALAPGYIETELNRDFFAGEAGQRLIKRIPQRRLGQLEDLDGALLYLASDASRYVTGSVVTVDGGHLVSSL